jgi:hypothetical protein
VLVLAMAGADDVTWPLVGWGAPSLATVDELLRWCVAARRADCSLAVRELSRDLDELLALAGLRALPELGLHPLGEAKGREEVDVQEVVQPGDPGS